MRKTTITYTAPPMPAAPIVAQPVEKRVVNEGEFNHPRMALWIGAFAGMGAFALSAAILYMSPGARQEWPLFVVFTLGAWLLTSAYFGYNWLKVAAVRSWRVEDEERNHRYQLEQQALPVEEDEEEDRYDTSALMLAGYKILAMHYVNGKDCTRPECEKAGIDQQTWNMVNRAMQTLKIKGERKWLEESYEKALVSWGNNVTWHDDGSAMIMISDTEWKRIDFTK